MEEERIEIYNGPEGQILSGPSVYRTKQANVEGLLIFNGKQESLFVPMGQVEVLQTALAHTWKKIQEGN